MPRLYQTILRLKYTLSYNESVYYLQKLPLLGKLIPDKLYSKRKSGFLVTLLLVVGNLFWIIVKKLFYLLFLVLVFGFLKSKLPYDETRTMALLLIVYHLVLGSALNGGKYYNFLMDDRILIKAFKVEPKVYMLLKEQVDNLEFLFFNSIALFLLLSILHLDKKMISILVVAIGIREAFAYIDSKLFRMNKTKDSLFGTLFSAFVSIFGITYFIFIDKQFGWAGVRFVYSWEFAVISLVIWAMVVFYFSKSEFINEVANKKIKNSDVLFYETSMEQINREEYQIKESHIDFKEQRQDDFDDYKGIAYINRLFFKRSWPYFRKLMIKRVSIGGVLACSGLIFSILYRDTIMPKAEMIFNNLIPVAGFFIGYIGYMGETTIKFIFFNMDKYLLKNSFYRRSDLLLESIVFRIKKLISFHFPLFMIQILFTIGMYLLIGQGHPGWLFFSLGSICIILLFYSLHYLFMYYLIQPFTEHMKVKSFSYSFLNSILYLVGYFGIKKIDRIHQNMILWGLIFLVLYTVVGLYLVKKKSPDWFKIRY